jgi:aryl-alcohol dehydrogenase-like predicted oxidoreductase
MITTAPFGRTGHDSSRVIFGGAGLFRRKWGQEWAEGVLDQVVAAGVNHLDTAASYGDSEVLMGPWLNRSVDGVRNRSRVFLATKTDERTADGARSQLERSLQRMDIDHVDLIQLHNLVEDDEWAQVHGPGGALEALVAAREEGLVSHIGVTGHGIRIAGMHRRSLAAFDYDSVLLPYNTTMLDHPAYRSDVEELLGECADRGVAVQTIKSIARRRWPADEAADVDEMRSWYQPLRDAGAIERAMRVVLANEQLFLNTSSDTRLMVEMLDAARTILGDGAVEPADPAEIRADIDTFGMAALFDGADLERI